MDAKTGVMYSLLQDYLSDPYPDAMTGWLASGHQPGDRFCSSELPPFRQGGFVVFSVSAFMKSIEVKRTQAVSKILDLLADVGVETRQTVTIRIDGKRHVIKAGRIAADNLVGRSPF